MAVTQLLYLISDMYLENYIEEELGNISLQVLRGEVIVEQEEMGNTSLQTGDHLNVIIY